MPVKKLIYAIPIVSLFLFLPSLSYAACVQPGESIQTAIDNAALNDTICIEPGTYNEKITLKDGITIQGLELARTIIDGGGTGSVVTATNLVNSTTIMNVTITNGDVGITVTDVSGVSISNVIVKSNTTGIACSEIDFPTVLTVDHAVIDDNTTGISFSGFPDFTITNSIISNNATDLNDASFITSSSGFNLTFNNTTKIYPTTDTTSILNSDPLFVARASNDYHLRKNTPPSPAIDAGTGTDPDTTTADIGAYGGTDMDTKPFPVSGLIASRVSDSSLTITWSLNNAYNITSYKVYFDSDASGPPYNGQQSDKGPSPITINDATVTSLTLSDLSAPAAGTAPSGLSTLPGNNKLTVSWNAVTGAAGYKVSYGTESGNYTNSVDVGNTTSYTIENLTNGVVYYIAVSAFFESKYFLSVSANDGQGHESALINEASVVLSRTEGPKSTEVTDFPEETAPFPDLGDENRCFIATAAFGSPLEPQVVLLRKFRDHFLLTNVPGRKLVSFYYDFSPSFADFIREHAWLKPVARLALLPFIGIAAFCLELSLVQQFVICSLLTLSLPSALIILGKRKRS